jgi:YD repeat-containing protein
MAGRSELKKSITTMYTGSGGILTSEHSYSYDPEFFYIKSDTTVDSKMRKEIYRSFYPADAIAANHDQNGVYQGMLGKNIINTVIASSKRSLSGLIDSISTVYKVTGMSYKPSEVWKTTLLNHTEKLLQFNKYDAEGNILERQNANGTKEAYLWGYAGQFPVAKVVGSDYTTISGFIDQQILDNAKNYDDTRIRTELNKIRSGLNTSTAQVTTYTYSNLFGVTSETDPKGNTVYYEYDGFGKLKNIKDYQGKVIKSFQYNYRGNKN